MEHPSPSPDRQKLSPAGEQRLHRAAAIHNTLWTDIFNGEDRIQRMAPDRRAVVDFRLPHIEQMLDFVRRYFACTINGEKRVGIEVVLPSRNRAHAEYNLVCRALLSHEFEIS